MSDDFSTFDTDALAAELARREQDAQAAASSTSRSNLAAGAAGDVGAPDADPYDLARSAISEGISQRHLGRQEAVALGVAQILNAALRGDQRVMYRGRVEPGI